MKKMFLVLCLTCLFGHAQFIEETYTQGNIWIDPVVTYKEGAPQLGLEITKVITGFFASVSFSYIELTPDYADLVAALGTNINLFRYDRIRYYSGVRGGFLRRDLSGKKATYGLVGLVIGLEWYVNYKRNWGFGAAYYIDYREDQKEQFYGDYNTYEPGLITNNPLLQENGKVYVFFRF